LHALEEVRNILGKKCAILLIGERMRTVIRNLLLATVGLAGCFALFAFQDSTTSTAPADNTSVNQRDRNQTEPTADQQKENRSDLELTKQIRRALLQDKSLSTHAHNVKIISKDGVVTLKGPVNSDVEKQAVESKAGEIAGSNKVISILEVAPNQ
jgi:osmotically-inducible protein OsmY